MAKQTTPEPVPAAPQEPAIESVVKDRRRIEQESSDLRDSKPPMPRLQEGSPFVSAEIDEDFSCIISAHGQANVRLTGQQAALLAAFLHKWYCSPRGK